MCRILTFIPLGCLKRVWWLILSGMNGTAVCYQGKIKIWFLLHMSLVLAKNTTRFTVESRKHVLGMRLMSCSRGIFRSHTGDNPRSGDESRIRAQDYRWPSSCTGYNASWEMTECHHPTVPTLVPSGFSLSSFLFDAKLTLIRHFGVRTD